MNEEIELGWLRLTDKRDLVLTTRHVLQQQDRGIFGQSHTIIPRHAITSVQISWQRSRGLLVVGTVLLVTYLILMIGSIIAGVAWEQALNLSSSTISLIEYGSLLAGIGIFILFWFHKRNEIQIMAPTATLEGRPQSYEEAKSFCSLLVSESKGQPTSARKSENEPTSSPKAADHDWRL
jgi:hypothetical protein